jgi:hypothetical protein
MEVVIQNDWPHIPSVRRVISLGYLESHFD